MNFDLFNDKCKIIINDAQNKAISFNHQQIITEHLLLSILSHIDSYQEKILNICNANLVQLNNDLSENLQNEPKI